MEGVRVLVGGGKREGKGVVMMMVSSEMSRPSKVRLPHVLFYW